MISYDELQKTVFDYSYGAALRDAIGQKAFEGNKIPLRNNEDAKAIARQYIDDILNGLSPDFYETVGKLENSFPHSEVSTNTKSFTLFLISDKSQSAFLAYFFNVRVF